MEPSNHFTVASFDDNDHWTRSSVLPCYPIHSQATYTNLLLANVPNSQLNEDDLQRRRTSGYHQPTSKRPATDDERQLLFLSGLWNIRQDILEFNFRRVMKLVDRLAAYRMQHFSTSFYEELLHEEEYSMALEFYLQIDLDLFYMKTCGYRGAQPIVCHQWNTPPIFATDPPESRYAMTPCRQHTCCLCFPSYRLTYRLHQPVVQFGPHQQHQFINGYRAILNCPATCTTKKIIYVLTCPCHQVDYIGETSLSLADRLAYHQAHGNRIIQETLLGQKNMARIRNQPKSFDMLVKDGMKLHQHSARCSSALQWFLDENPDYWPFIPTTMTDAEEYEEEREIAPSIRDIHPFVYANDVPSPPNHCRFTSEQKRAIDEFFFKKKYLTSSNTRLDLYQAKIIAVLPTNSSDAFRRLIEALFITQAETKLNSIGHFQHLFSSDNIDLPPVIIDNAEWCQHLIHRSS